MGLTPNQSNAIKAGSRTITRCHASGLDPGGYWKRAQAACVGPASVSAVTDGAGGLRRLPTGGGAQPAPCRNGTVAFVNHGDIYLLARDRRSQRRITFRGGDDPDCSPDSHAISFVRKGAVYTIAATGRKVRRVASPQSPHARKNGPCGGPNAPSRNLYAVPAAVFSPNGRRIAFLASYSPGDGDCTFLELADRRGRRTAPPTVVAADSGPSSALGSTSSLQPRNRLAARAITGPPPLASGDTWQISGRVTVGLSPRR